MRQAAVPFWSPAEIEASLSETAAHLQAGRVLAYPTETVYGVGVDATNQEAVKKLLEDYQAGVRYLQALAKKN